MAISKISTKGMSGDTLDAGDIAPNAIGASELADNAVDTAAIAATSITEAKLNADVTDGSAIQTGVKPHIQPGTLYPAWSGLLEDNTGPYTFTDSGPGAHATTGYSGVHHTGIQKKVGSTSIKFDGVNDQIKTVDHADFDISGQFTIECWVYVNTITAYDGILSFDGTGSADFTLGFGTGGNTTKIYLYSHAGNATAVVNSVATISLNQWYHVAVSRDGSNNTRFYLDGVHKGVSTSYTAGHTTQSGGLALGKFYNAADEKFLDGYLDQVRVSNTARYTGTSSFTPSTSAYASDANTKFLLQSDIGGHSGAYGTAQSDGLSYYYTDIKGSKPIKDPRIGSHFGSQRFQMTSVQTLEQETATHGRNVYTIDGREWMKAVGTITMSNNQYGNYIDMEDDDSPMAFIEVVGYFNDANISLYTTTNLMAQCAVNGGSLGSNLGTSTVDSPLGGRFVHNGSVLNTGITATLGINTLRIEPYDSSGHNTKIHAVELIAQDTTSTATKSQIQIPSQNVVSYGKKFTVSETKHYNPFAFKTDGSTAWASGAHNGTSWPVGTGSSANIDTATSLGLAAWLHSSNYYKPYNGGRVVKWVANDGTIKTSVNMMPPNARNADGLAVSAKANASVANNTYLPTFEAGTIDYSQSEVAKTFYNREFGNGSANGNATYLDSSTVDAGAAHSTAYVMDDGLTSAAATIQEGYNHGTGANTNGYAEYHTFIGTGYTYIMTNGTVLPIAQNLPYGTHLFKKTYVNASSQIAYMDGVQVRASATHTQQEMSFHQPKMPPIPEDAVVIADYMLMADYVPQTSGTAPFISKGVRRNNASRDVFYNASAGSITFGRNINHAGGFQLGSNASQSADVFQSNLPAFATKIDSLGYGDRRQIYVGSGSAETQTVSGSTYDAVAKMTNAQTLGLHTFKSKNKGSTDGTISAIDVATPIHTSSHYQSFETPFLNELVGGDRNMEQNNLVVTPDGKTWDEVTRDTSYIGNLTCMMNTDTETSWATVVIFDEWRGDSGADNRNHCNKDFAIAYDRIICLRDGQYRINSKTRTDGTNQQGGWHKTWYCQIFKLYSYISYSLS